jgi:hypothetical protein
VALSTARAGYSNRFAASSLQRVEGCQRGPANTERRKRHGGSALPTRACQQRGTAAYLASLRVMRQWGLLGSPFPNNLRAVFGWAPPGQKIGALSEKGSERRPT